MNDDQYESDRFAEKLSVGLGCFSVVLGAAELFAPRQVARFIGLSPSGRRTALLRTYGAREIASGIAILSQPSDPRWLWSRVGGDAIDLATLGGAAGDDDTDQSRVSLAAAAVMAVTALDVLCARRLSTANDTAFDGGDEQAVTVRAPLEQAEEAWTQWCASGNSRLRNNYAVRFEPAPGARGTEVRLSGGGTKGTIREELRRFKQFVETGEIPVSDGPGLWRPAQPAADAQEVKALAGVQS